MWQSRHGHLVSHLWSVWSGGALLSSLPPACSHMIWSLDLSSDLCSLTIWIRKLWRHETSKLSSKSETHKKYTTSLGVRNKTKWILSATLRYSELFLNMCKYTYYITLPLMIHRPQHGLIHVHVCTTRRYLSIPHCPELWKETTFSFGPLTRPHVYYIWTAVD